MNPRHFHQLYGENPDNLQKIEKLLGLEIVPEESAQNEGDEKSLKQCEELFGLLEMGREQGMVTKKSDFTRFLEKVSKGRVKTSQLLNDHLF